MDGNAQVITPLLVETKIKEMLEIMFKLSPEHIAGIDRTANLFDQIGIDSLEAFDAIVTLHDLLEEEIPRDIDPTTIGTLEKLGVYLVEKYPQEKIKLFFESDIAAQLADRAGADDEL